MTLPEFSIKRRVTTFMIYTALVLFGVMSFANLAIDLMPSFEVPVAIVQTRYSGAGPYEIEDLITKPLEQTIARVSGIDGVRSTSSEGLSVIVVQFADEINMSDALIDMREKIDMIKPMLPDTASSPVVTAIDPQSMPIMQGGIDGDIPIEKMQIIADDILTPNLERINGVASVDVMGGYSNEVVINTYGDRMHGYNLTIDYLSNILRAENIALPSGQVYNGNKVLTVRTTGEYKTVEDIENTLIPLPTGGTIKLSEIASVSMQPGEIDTVAKLNGKQSLFFAIQKQSGVNTVEVSKKIYNALDIFSKQNPGLSVSIVFDQADYINLSVNSVIQNVIYGIIFAVIVLIIFLKNFKTTMVIAISMPVCLIGTFVILKMLDLTMNIMTLGGMAMGVGMIVDNSVVVLENVYRYRSEGNSRYDSCVKGTKEVSLAITASTLTTIAVFLPIGLSAGMTGDMFREFCLTIGSLLVASLFIALTLVPLLCYITLDKDTSKSVLADGVQNGSGNNLGRNAFSKKMFKMYDSILRICLKHRKLSLVGACACFVVFLSSLFFTGIEFIPATDQGMISMNISLPMGSQILQTAQIADEVVSLIEGVEDIEDIFYYYSDESSSVIITLLPMDQRDRSVFEVADDVRTAVKDVAGAKISISDSGAMDMSALAGNPISLSISGDDFGTLEHISDDLVDKISGIPGTYDVKSSMSERIPQVEITLDRQNASRFGLTASQVGSAVNAQLNGVTSTRLKMSGEEIDVVVKGDGLYGANVESLKAIPITTQTGLTIPLDVVADIDVTLSSVAIERIDQTRTITISGNSRGDISKLSKQVDDIINTYQMPTGYAIDVGGQREEITESFTTLLNALIISVALVYFILASQFESLLFPFIIMLAMPLGLAGGLFGLFITGTSLSIPAFIGVIMLAGIVVNNSIVLIDYIHTRQGFGEDMQTAILKACPLRIRPVMMTTLTTILGLMPMAFAIGEGSEIMAPMAIVMVSGLTISTVVTLVFTPVFYAVLSNSTEKRKQRKESRRQKKLSKTASSGALGTNKKQHK